MKERIGARTILVAPLLVSGLMVSGCMSSPTYGTGVTANEQLASDLSGMFSMKPKRTSYDYAPRPELVKPAKGTTELPAPQENIVATDAGQWPESPEQKRARLRAEATENRDDPNWRPDVVNDLGTAGSTKTAKLGTSGRASESGVARAGEAEDLNKLGQQARQARAAATQGSPTVRRTLTEPPIDYRQPAPTAATDDLGEDEFKKQRRLKAEAKKAAGTKKTWKDMVPWL
ncbi:MAG: hypothetical protein KF810_06845 [Rhizobiaceae bacterium]|nr:hypothetical protein [Rhizobiaceae bacterium]